MRDIQHRCRYVNMNNPLYIQYHDDEWGIPEHNDKKLFELLLLECFQAGLSWECILNKRENFRKALITSASTRFVNMMMLSAPNC